MADHLRTKSCFIFVSLPITSKLPTRRNCQTTVAVWQPGSANLAPTKYGNVEHDVTENIDDDAEDSIDQLRHGDKEKGSFCDGIWQSQ